jgi:hypothetical protein
MAVNDQCRERRLAAPVSFQHDQVQDLADPVPEGHRRADT